MKYRLKVGEDVSEMEVSSTENPQSLRVTLAGRDVDVSYQRVSENDVWMLVEGKATRAFVARNDEGTHVFVTGRCYLVQDADRLTLGGPKPGLHEETLREVTPPMPSVVVRLLVSEGAVVKKGQGLVVVTAMKMETTLGAPYDGQVKKINVALNQKVAPGDILVEIEEALPGEEVPEND